MNAKNRRWLFAAIGTALSLCSFALVAACAGEGETGAASTTGDGSSIPSPTLDGGIDGDGDAACVGVDCEYFPADCTADALCYGGLFNPASPEEGFDLRTQITALAARSPSDAWLAGTVGQLGHFDGTTWKASLLGNQQSLTALWLYGNSEIAFDQPKRIYTRGFDAGSDAAVSADGWSFAGPATVSGNWGSDSSVAVTWAHPEGSTLWAGAIARFATAGLWRMRHSAETGFTFAALPITGNAYITSRAILGIHGLSPNELWAVGSSGSVVRVTDAESDSPTIELYDALTQVALEGVWVAAPNDVWAVGTTGTVRRYKGDPRYLEVYEQVPTKQHLRAISGSSPNDVWIAGDDAAVFHFDGTAWKRIKVAGLGTRRPRLEHVWAPAPGKVWIAGQGALFSLGGKP